MSRKKLIRTLVPLLLVLGVVLYRTQAPRQRELAAQAPVAISADTTGFTYGKLHFTRCELPQLRSAATTAAYCAPFQVPENWDTPDAGRRIDLRLALIASDAEVAAADLVLLLAGGPGQSAVDSWPQVAGAFAPLRRHRHVLLLDQRGTGGSNALTCERAQSELEQGFDLDLLRTQTRDCLDKVAQHADPRYYTTGMALRDLEAVRQALGAPAFDLVGVSYGTRVAQQYLKAYPHGVRSVLLDSAVPNDHVLGSEFAINLDASLRAQFALCTQTPACANAFGDPWASLRALRDALHAQPQDVAYRDPVDHARKQAHLDSYALAMLARMYAYTPETAALLPLSVAQARKGDYTPLVGQVQMLLRDLEELGENAMQLSVICSEDADRLAPRPQDADTLLGAQMIEAFRAQCAIWPHGARAVDFAAPASGDTPVLLLAGEFDPVTPPRYAEAIAKTLPNARVLVASGQGHSVMGRGCLPRLVADFVDTLDPKRLDAGCIADFAALPAFINFNGAAP
jgi:pimeloyl-ACP methyl ester carboxylesterase